MNKIKLIDIINLFYRIDYNGDRIVKVYTENMIFFSFALLWKKNVLYYE